MDEEKIRKEAKQIMDDFMSALDKVEEVKEEFGTKRAVSKRKPSKSRYGVEFKERMLKNAPKVEDSCIVAEKKKW
jgi:hypothetical protein